MWYDELDHLDLAEHTSRMQDTTEEIKNEQDVLIDEFEDGEEVATECFDHIEKLVGSIDYLNTKGRADRLFMVMYDREMVEMGYPSVESLDCVGMEGLLRDIEDKIREWIKRFFDWLKGLWKKFWRMFGFYKDEVEEKVDKIKKAPEMPAELKREIDENKWAADPTEIEKAVLALEKSVGYFLEDIIDVSALKIGEYDKYEKDLQGIAEKFKSKEIFSKTKDPKKLTRNEVVHLAQVADRLYKLASRLEVADEKMTKKIRDEIDKKRKEFASHKQTGRVRIDPEDMYPKGSGDLTVDEAIAYRRAHAVDDMVSFADRRKDPFADQRVEAEEIAKTTHVVAACEKVALMQILKVLDSYIACNLGVRLDRENRGGNPDKDGRTGDRDVDKLPVAFGDDRWGNVGSRYDKAHDKKS